MKTLYIECNMGAAGDMLMAALYELLEDRQGFLDVMNGLGLPGVRVEAVPAVSCGIAGTHMAVTVNGAEECGPDGAPAGHGSHPHEHGVSTGHSHEHDGDTGHSHGHGGTGHSHTSPGSIADRISRLKGLPEEVKKQALSVYERIAAAEAKAHGCPVGDVHFHEVGALDAVADVTGVCYAMYLLGAERVVVSPVHAGSGTVRCAHGVMPVPAPATANLLEGIPFYGGEVRGELCTPTGAALLGQFGDEFGSLPLMTVRKTGIGIGTKQFDRPNCVRVFLGDDGAALCGRTGTAGDSQDGKPNGTIVELVSNLDDMTPEMIAYACERLLDEGALDVYTVGGTMKKGRPGHVLTVLCREGEEDLMARNIFRETATNGIRMRRCEKYFLTPGTETAETRLGKARVKTASGFGAFHAKPEYEDAASLARENGIPYREAAEEIMKTYRDRCSGTE